MRCIDVMKGIVIIGVVLSHIVISKYSEAGTPAFYLHVLYLGLMGFFLISGYFYRPDRCFLYNMIKRFKQLLLAVALCALLLPNIQYGWLAVLGQAPGFDDYVLALQWGFGQYQVFEPLPADLYHNRMYPICGAEVGYYFIWTMLTAFIIFYALADHVAKDNRRLAAMIIALLIITALGCEFGRYRLPFFIELVPIASVFMFAGAGMAKYGIAERIDSFRWKEAGHRVPLTFPWPLR